MTVAEAIKGFDEGKLAKLTKVQMYHPLVKQGRQVMAANKKQGWDKEVDRVWEAASEQDKVWDLEEAEEEEWVEEDWGQTAIAFILSVGNSRPARGVLFRTRKYPKCRCQQEA